MFVSDFWTKILRIFGIIFLGAQVFLIGLTLDEIITARSNTIYIQNNPNNYISDVEIDSKGAHKDDKTYTIADKQAYWVSSEQPKTYDKENLCVFFPYTFQIVFQSMAISLVVGVVGCLLLKSKKILITDIILWSILSVFICMIC